MENRKNCMLEAYRLQLKNGGGRVCHVPSVGHTYYIREGASEGDFALNQKDNGFSGFPALRVGEVLRMSDDRFLMIGSD